MISTAKQTISDAALADFCHFNALRWDALAEDRQEVESRLKTCHHDRGFDTIRGERVCRDCGEVLSKDAMFAMAYGGV